MDVATQSKSKLSAIDYGRVLKSLQKFTDLADPQVVPRTAKALGLPAGEVRIVVLELKEDQTLPGAPVSLETIQAEVDVNTIIERNVRNVLEKHPDKTWSDDDFRLQVCQCQIAAAKWKVFSESSRWKDYRARNRKYNIWAAKETAATLRQMFGSI